MMTTTNARDLMIATRGFVQEFNWTNPVAVTLTMKSAIFKDGILIHGSAADYSSNLDHFLNKLNKQLFGGLARKGWLLSVFAVLERGALGRDHYHLTLDKPTHLTAEQFARLIKAIWRKTTWGQDRVDVSPDGNERWINYMTKLRSKRDYADSIDWLNTYSATTPLSAIKIPFRLRMRHHPNDELSHLARYYGAKAEAA